VVKGCIHLFLQLAEIHFDSVVALTTIVWPPTLIVDVFTLVVLCPHILNTPNFVSGTGALSAALNASASTRRVSAGAMMPSSHSRAVA